MNKAKRAILALLNAEGPLHGVGLAEAAERKCFALPYGSLYPALKSLQSDGLIEPTDGPQTSTRGRPRRYWQLTGAGKNALAESAPPELIEVGGHKLLV